MAEAEQIQAKAAAGQDSMTKPAETFHVWTFIEEELKARGWSVRDLAERMVSDEETSAGGRELSARWWELDLGFLSQQKEYVSTGEAVHAGLARAFGTSAEYWTNLDKAWKKAQP